MLKPSLFSKVKSFLRNSLNSLLINNPQEPLTLVGSNDKWSCYPERLGKDSVVVCAGVGRSISFEHDLIRRTGCRILLLDPSPTGIDTMNQEINQSKNIEFWPVGLAGKDGHISFGKPDRLEEGSWKSGSVNSDDSFPCRSLSSLIQQYNWPCIDLLKIDIEGFEYEVVDDILMNKLPIKQFCVEFHYKGQIGIKQTYLHMLFYFFKLRIAMYKFVDLYRTDCTFVRI